MLQFLMFFLPLFHIIHQNVLQSVGMLQDLYFLISRLWFQPNVSENYTESLQ